jgi:broad specificity phosphatase PhoE
MAWRPRGGESWLDMQARVTRYLHDAIFPAGHENVLIVRTYSATGCHGAGAESS